MLESLNPLDPTNEPESIPSITFPEGSYTHEHKGLCVICARGLIRDSRPFMWAACVSCRKFDRAVARTFGGKVFLPLGLHSIMNGAAVSVRAKDLVQQAQIEAVLAVARSWNSLFEYKEVLVHDMAVDAGWEHQDSVPWIDWSAAYPASFEASLHAYQRLIHTNYQWVEQLLPQISDIDWLTAAADERDVA